MPSTAKTGWSSMTLTTLFQSQGAVASDPGPERLLAGLVNIVPELAKPGETQGLVGYEPRAVIDHEDEPAGQQQQADKPKETADHASPYICAAQRPSANTGGTPEIQPHQHLIAPFPAPFSAFRQGGKR